MIFFLRSIFAQTLLNAYFVYRIWRSKEIHLSLKWILSFVYGAETLLYFFGLFAFERLPIEDFTLIQKISGIWVLAHIYLFILLASFDITRYLKRKYSLWREYPDKITWRIRLVLFIVLSTLIGCELYIGYENFLNPEVKTIPFVFNPEKKSEGGKPLKTYKMLVASDIHLGYIIDKETLQRYVELINAQHADIVVIDGDLIDYTLRPLIEQKMDEDLKKIKAPKGVFFIPGNHEYKFNPELKLDWVARTGMTILKDSIANIDNTLWLIGRDDRDNEENRMPIEKLMAKADTSKPCIFLSHQPGDIPDAYTYKIPLTVCGHTHGGQAFPMNLIGSFLYPYNYGWKQKENCTTYITSGLGLSGFPLRIATHSEIVVFNISVY